MDQVEHEAFCQAVRDRLDEINASYVADFDIDDSGCVLHVVEPEDA